MRPFQPGNAAPERLSALLAPPLPYLLDRAEAAAQGLPAAVAWEPESISQDSFNRNQRGCGRASIHAPTRLSGPAILCQESLNEISALP